jgi:hypothetical protein
MITFLLAIALLCVIASQLNTNILYIFIFTIAAFTIGGMTAVQITALSLLVWLSIEVAIYYAAWLRKHVGWVKCQQGLLVAVRF